MYHENFELSQKVEDQKKTIENFENEFNLYQIAKLDGKELSYRTDSVAIQLLMDQISALGENYSIDQIHDLLA